VTRQAPAGGGPRYAVLAETLAAAIAAGVPGLGERLPTEAQLAATHGVSRATVREALRRLRAQGLVEPVHGVGTRVIAERPRPTYEMAVRSLADLMGYGGPTRLDIARRDRIVVDPALAALLGDGGGQAMLRLSGVRCDATASPLAVVEMFVPAAFAAAAEAAEVGRTPIYRLIERQWHIPVVDMRQEIAALSLPLAAAQALGVRAGAPGLRIVRRFYGKRALLLEATVNLHAAAPRFAYAIRLAAPDERQAWTSGPRSG
jgi:DNA-binding GntR family transcriptional regulator